MNVELGVHYFSSRYLGGGGRSVGIAIANHRSF